MSVRRLAKVQPASFAFEKATKAKLDWWIQKYPADRRQSAVIPALWLIQKQEGWVSEPAIRTLADYLGMAYIRVLEVATFYTMFMLEPVGSAALIQVCGTTPCMLRGAGDLMKVCKSRIGPKQTLSADGKFYWEEVECLGACVNAPMAMVNDYYHEDLTAADMEAIIDGFAAGKPLKPGPRVNRVNSAPEGGALTLTDAKLYDGSAAVKITKLPNSDPAPAPEKAPA
jgi:NADH-quinone oxidoreductase subunit E